MTSEGVVLVLRRRELSACVAGYLVSLHSLPEDAIAVSCDREFAYVLTARGQGARLLRIHLSGDNKGLQQTLLTTEDRPRALCAVRGGCLVASGGNIVKVSDPAPAADNAEGQVATVLLAAIQEPVTSVVADEKQADRLLRHGGHDLRLDPGTDRAGLPCGQPPGLGQGHADHLPALAPGQPDDPDPRREQTHGGPPQATRQGQSRKTAMSDDHQATTCSRCGSGDLTIGVPLGLTAETGHVGPQFKDGLLLVGTEPLLVDLCTACGHVQRLYVKNPDHRWLT